MNMLYNTGMQPQPGDAYSPHEQGGMYPSSQQGYTQGYVLSACPSMLEDRNNGSIWLQEGDQAQYEQEYRYHYEQKMHAGNSFFSGIGGQQQEPGQYPEGTISSMRLPPLPCRLTWFAAS